MARFERAAELLAVAVDYLIAATAEAVGARLSTLNARHFAMFPGLQSAYE